MKKVYIGLGIVSLVGLCALSIALITSSHVASTPATDQFPIVSRFEMPRDYGYFIGDEIPLSLVIETHGDVVLNLINLPQKGDKHGPFEIRDLTITSVALSETHTVYRASYILQYFGATPFTAPFDGLEILYALASERHSPEHTYTYKSLLTQPTTINVSRIGPFYPTHALDLKGPLHNHRDGLILASFLLGVALLLAACGSGLVQWRRYRARYHASLAQRVSPLEQAMATLRQEGRALQPVDALALPVVTRFSQIVRQYLQHAYGVSAFTSTCAELAVLLHDRVLGPELVFILERCDAFKYDPYTNSPGEERQLWWETITLFEKLQEVQLS
jgi:hypothetical protein